MSTIQHEDRRPIKVRAAQWSRKAAAYLADADITPNQISLASIGFAAVGAALLFIGGWAVLLAAFCIQGRLLCNLFDGMVAVEHGKGSVLGPVFNEFPDRIADSLLLVAAGYAAGSPAWGWLAALAAALTAYVRVYGAACGLGHDFRGPMAKQHRMSVLTAACLIAPMSILDSNVLYGAVVTIAVLSLYTCVTRTRALCAALEQKAIS